MNKTEYIFNEPGFSNRDSFPIGNGDIGAMVWADDKGQIFIEISKTDSFSSALRLLKIGRVVIKIREKNLQFKSHKLDIKKAITTVEYINSKSTVKVFVFVDANNPCIRVGIEADQNLDIDLKSVIWRIEDVRILGNFKNPTTEYMDFFGQDNIDEPIIVYKDTVCNKYDEAVIWYHHNKTSHYLPSLKYQNIDDLAHLGRDPLKDRNFGACIISDSFIKNKALEMSTKVKALKHNICIGVLTKQTVDEEKYISELYDLTLNCSKIENAKDSHIEYWKNCFENSYINISGDVNADLVDVGYSLQRYINICAGRGEFPIKFNGSIFVPDILNEPDNATVDYRKWGGGYWFQNTRLIYWSILESGDYALMKPFFDMYQNVFDLCSAKVKKHLGIDGVLYYETMSMWGVGRNIGYGVDRGDLNKAFLKSPYMRYYFSGMLELLVIMIEYVLHTEDFEFANKVLNKQAEGIINFYMNFYTKTDENGKIIFYPSQSLENWQDAKNPIDVVAGLRYVIENLLKMNFASEKLIEKWKLFYDKLPNIPVFESGCGAKSGTVSAFKPADWYDKLGNVENPELYAVFPYRIAGFDNEYARAGIETYARRDIRSNVGWSQDGIQAAVLGLPNQSKRAVIDKFSNGNKDCKFTAYWGPNFDWVSDQDNGCSGMIAVHKMLLQAVDDKIFLFPAWPSEWDVEFKMHTHKNTVVHCIYKSGEIKLLETNPTERIKDVEICFDRQRYELGIIPL